MLSVGHKTFTRGGSANPFSLHDTGAATAFLALQATHLGLHTHSMGGYDQAKARAAFGIPEDYDMGAVTAIGYFGGLDSLDDSLREREAAPRTRKPLGEFVFGEWNQPAPFLSGQ
jgi:nitroreductase